VKRATFVLKAARLANETLDGINNEKVTTALLSMEHGSTAVALYRRLTEGPMRALPLGAASDGEIIDVPAAGSTEEVVERCAEAMRKVEGPGRPRPEPTMTRPAIRKASLNAAFDVLFAPDDVDGAEGEGDDEPTETVSWDSLKNPGEADGVEAAEGG